MNLIEKIKWFFWPVEQKEQKQTILMIIVLFLVSFVYSILRTLKITILLADPTLPSQALSYLKIFGIMPAAIVFTWFAIKIQTTVGQRKTFFIMNAVFALIFSILTFCVLPYQEAFHLHFSGQHELISLLNSWYITIFYVAAEMWSSIMLNMLCWGVIIEITGHKDSPRLYSIFSLAANLATYAAGWWGSSTIKAQVKYFMNTNNPTWDQSLLYQMIVLLICQALIMVFFHVAISSQSDRHQKTLSKKVRLGLKEC
ncbi:MAG: hypothetical protein FJ161_00580, partial [Gammaproteobacteria bacterium]|nr:hypothetical protein [Gammaproteobacteria bacterium]